MALPVIVEKRAALKPTVPLRIFWKDCLLHLIFFLRTCWNQFLLNLSIAIDNLQMALNCDVILGGHLAPYLNQEDLNTLILLVTKDSAFNQGRPAIHLSKKSCIARGAALYQIRQFIDSV